MTRRIYQTEVLEARLLLSRPPMAAPIEIGHIDAPEFITTADINNDGRLDLITSSFNGSDLTLFTGNGKGGFKVLTRVPLAAAPDFVTAANLNGDHFTDLVTVSFTNNSVTVLLGSGDGTFRSTVYSGGTGPRAAVVGDFNGDGKPDIALAKSFDKNITLLFGNGDGTFKGPVNRAVNFTPSDLVAGDFNHDGVDDLAAVDFSNDQIDVLINNRNATFQSPQVYATGSGPSSIAAADIDGDGNLDLISANLTDDNLTLLAGNSNGTFQSPQTIAAGDGPTFVTTADVDRDGHVDLIVANSRANTAGILIGNGDDSFQDPIDFATGDSPRSIVTADFSRDHRPDIAVANESSASISLIVSDNSPPVVSLASAPDLTSGGGTNYTFTINYSDNVLVNRSSLDDSDIFVTGSNGFSATATLLSSTSTSGIYSIDAPQQFWKSSDNATYTIALQANQVSDTANNFAAAVALGTFDINITDPGNDFATATSFGSIAVGSIRAAADYVGPDDRNDFYRIDLTQNAGVYVKLYNLTDDADLQLLDSDGNRIAYSKHTGDSAEFFTLALTPGTYYARVIFSNGMTGTGYRLRFEGM
jgi:hypothetical protein